jgi:hypothetical protein
MHVLGDPNISQQTLAALIEMAEAAERMAKAKAKAAETKRPK